MNELYKKCGFAEGAVPPLADKLAKFAAYAMGDATPEDIKGMADDLDKEEDEKAKAMAAKFKKFAEAPAAPIAAAEPFAGEESPEEEPARRRGQDAA